MARPFNAYGDTSVEITEPSHRLVHVLIIRGSAPVEKSAVRAGSSSIVFPFALHITFKLSGAAYPRPLQRLVR